MRECRSRIARSFIIGRRFAPTRWLHPGYIADHDSSRALPNICAEIIRASLDAIPQISGFWKLKLTNCAPSPGLRKHPRS
jgi:hypothetical protein